MTQLLGERANAIDDILLRELFLQRLAQSVQMVLAAAAPLNLAGLPGLADAVTEVASPSISTAAALTSKSAGNTYTTAQDIREPNASQYNVDDLCQRLEQVVIAATRRRDTARSPNRRRRSTSIRPDNDRSSRVGEASGKASKTVARHIPGSTGNIDAMRAQAGTLAGEVMRARQGLTERGEALTQLEERTGRMMTEAESFANTTHQLMNKYKDKKWYQF
ncbi:hypothetical protein HPB47_013409 [Ixodes persulcatus]|uniref:Uncharacterized protein n=2 Tax=Ixodes persulcatus TaxID=34615 RepID=A0AC60R124_IXOPE|nr:hypothetical protein HPB47_026709 [Ixodes persulcatus]KAG0445623.1 hypothetical protein HPB47_013409 [Ixodes persulcatus]